MYIKETHKNETSLLATLVHVENMTKDYILIKCKFLFVVWQQLTNFWTHNNYVLKMSLIFIKLKLPSKKLYSVS